MKKLTKNQFREMVQEEISNLAENNYHQIGSPPNPANNLGMGTISEDEDEYEDGSENKPPSDAMRKLAGSDDIASFLLLKHKNKGKKGEWVVKKIGVDEEKPAKDFCAALTSWFHQEKKTGTDWTIEFREFRESRKGEPVDESKKITKGMVRKMIEEEFQNVMTEEEPEENAISHAWLGADHDREVEEEESTEFAESVAALETMHQNLEGIIDRLKEVPGAPLGTNIAMALPGLDEQEREE